MKLATSTNIMDFDDKRPYQIPIDVSTRACAKAGYKYVDACLCSHCREGQPLEERTGEKMDCGYRSTGRRTRCEIHPGTCLLDHWKCI